VNRRAHQPDRLLVAVVRSLNALPKPVLLSACLLVVGGLALLDRATGPYISLAVFYLLPVTCATWFLGRVSGLAVATICGGLWFLDQHSAVPQDMPLPVLAWMCVVRMTFFILVMWLIATLRAHADFQRALASTDEMTGVANRRAFLNTAQRELARARRLSTPLTVAFLDVDNLKPVNDTLGHATGDQVLRILAQTIALHIRESDLIARIGGDEFVVLLPDTDHASADAVVSKLRSLVAREMAARNWPVTTSIGVATFRRAPVSVEELITRADALQYDVKRNGKDRILHQVFDTPTRVPGGDASPSDPSAAAA
jgi:diguanylate cyclase (GGDEF)-like protein